MSFDLKARIFRSSFFCCCIPVRAGFVLMSILTFLLSGAISIIIWFEIRHSHFSHKERVAFILTGVVESLLCVVSTIGFVGVVARKQLFVMIYTYFIYAHFVLNIGVGVYFLVTVRPSNRQQLVDYCAEVFVDTSIESDCARLMSVSTYVFIAIVVTLLLLELYGALIAARYVYRLQTQKRDNRSRRLGYFHAVAAPETPFGDPARQASDDIELLRPQDSTSDPRDPEDGVLDTCPSSYEPVPTHDHDWTPVRAAGSPLLIADPLLDSTSSRRIRALPPRPADSAGEPSAPEMSSRVQKGVVLPARLPNPHGLQGYAQTPESEEERRSLYTAEVSSTTHAALMDHASYLRTTFTDGPPVPKFSRG